MRKTFLVVLAAGIFATCAMATTINVPYATNNQEESFTFSDGGGDTLDLIGQTGLLPLDSSSIVTNAIFTGTYTTRSTPNTGVRSFDLMYDLTLGGVTHTMTQPSVWTITLGPDSFVAGAGSPVEFDTGLGDWIVRPNSFTIDNGARVGTVDFSVQADFTPQTVPEPSTLGLIGTALAGLFLMRRKRPVQS